MRLQLADTVVVVDASRWRCLLRVLRRTWRLRGTEVAVGCPHRVDLGHLRYIWRYPRRNQPRRDAAVASLGPEVRVVRLRNRREVREFVASC